MADFEDDINSLNNDRDLAVDDAPFETQSGGALHDFKENIYSKMRDVEERCDSGINSMGCSLQSESSLESCTFLRRKVEQCETIHENVSANLKNLSLDDEGISSLPVSNEKPAVLDDNDKRRFQVTGNRIVIDFSEQDKDGDTFVNFAIIGGNELLACTLIDMVPNVECLNIPNALYQRPVHLAVLTKQVKVLQKVLSKNVDISCQDHQGNTPLHLACRNGDFSCVHAILKFVRERRVLQCLEVRNSEGLTCLHVAARVAENKMDIMRELISSGANVNASDAKSGRTILHYACERRDVELVRFLVKYTIIEIDCVAFDGKPAIYIAYWRNYQDIVKRLVKAGADFDYDVLNDVSDDSDDEYK